MATNEYQISDSPGKFTQVVKDGRKLKDVSWIAGRILLSNRRIVLVGNQGKRTIPLSAITELDGRYDVNQMVAQVSSYLSFRCESDVLLVHTGEQEQFEIDCFRALLDRRIALVRHPAVEGGVVQDSEWSRARMTVDEDGLSLASRDGAYIRIDLAEVSAVDSRERNIEGQETTIIEIGHSVEGTSVETHLIDSDDRGPLIESFFRRLADENETSIELDSTQAEVVMALYSGISPFEIPDFLGMEVDAVEDIYLELIETNILDERRVRRDVELTTRGRNIASQTMNDQ